MESLVGLKNTQYLCWGNKPYRSLMLLFTLYEPVHETGARSISVIGAKPKWFDAEPRNEGIETIRVIMKDGKIYKNTL